jgi:hypothetical protein
MAIPYIGNDDYLSIDGEDVSDLRGDIEYNLTLSATDVTIGSGNEWEQMGSGMKKMELSYFIAYPTNPADLERVLRLTSPGEHYIVYGPEGNGAGSPRYAGRMICTAAPLRGGVKKDTIRGFQCAAVNAGIPDAELHKDKF